MKQLFIPTIGYEFTLAEDWKFELFYEYRNDNALEHFGAPEIRNYWTRDRDRQFYPVTIPTGALLKIDRIYIRKGNSEFDSVTFYMKGGNKTVPFQKGRPKAVRFWAKLDDVNRIKLV